MSYITDLELRRLTKAAGLPDEVAVRLGVLLRSGGGTPGPPGPAGPGFADGDYGDITISGSVTALTIDNDVVTNAKSANMNQSTIKGRAAGAGTGDPTDLTATQATAILDSYAGSAKGLVPAGAGTSTNYLSEDGSWSAPAGATNLQMDVYNLADTGTNWSKPANAKIVEVICIGAGGGGGGGIYAGNGGNRTGGGGGGGGCVNKATFSAADLPSTVTVIVGAGGAGGVGGTSPTNGGNGGYSTFGDRLLADGGDGGGKGINGAIANGGDGGWAVTGIVGITAGSTGVGHQGSSGSSSPPISTEWGGAGGGRCNVGSGNNATLGGYSLFGGAGGGGGGQKASTNANTTSSSGGITGCMDRAFGAAYRAAGGGDSTNGNDGTQIGPYCGGGGGGGGASSATNGGVAGNGGNGGIGSGGGGGGAAGNTGATPTGGNGGAGGDGRIIVITYF